MEEFILLKVIALSLIEALTEFLPISSTAHLLVFAKIFQFYTIKNNIFEISVQTGAMFAILLFYHKKLSNLLFTCHNSEISRDFVFKIIISTIPAVLFGFFGHDFIKSTLFSPIVIAISLIIGGVIIIFIENLQIKPKFSDIKTISKKQALFIGLCQALAIIPGVSRSGATIMGGIFLKLDRKAIVEFSFFLAIPIIFGATAFDLYQNFELLNLNDFKIISIGIIVSAIFSLFVIKFLLYFVSNFSFKIFAYYRILFGLFILFFLF